MARIAKKAVNMASSRVGWVVFLVLIQVVLICASMLVFQGYAPAAAVFYLSLSIVVVLIIVNKQDNPAYKLALVIPIMAFPVFGGLFYLIFGRRHLSRKKLARVVMVEKEARLLLPTDNRHKEEISKEDVSVGLQVGYLQDMGGSPCFAHTATRYLPIGEEFFRVMMEKLRAAKYFIFLEYFIIQEGFMWNEILDVLIEKVEAGVEVRVCYDDIGCSLVLPPKYDKYLESLGIKCRVFNPFKPVLSIGFNNRDHRKITVVDGYVAFAGGINLADEYINVIDRYGHWKDSGVMLEGDAAWSFTVMFLTMWNSTGDMEDNTPIDNFRGYLPHQETDEPYTRPENDGYVIPFGTGPATKENLGTNVYLNMITRSKESVFIFTPYFVVDNETLTALCLAAKSGVDVRIITPFRYDKWYVHMVTRSYYQQLIEAGVKVYEYTPGFLHSKCIVCDREIAVVGSINFDFRSMYLHFECAAFMYKSKAVGEVLEDFYATQEKSHMITLKDCYDVGWPTRLMRSVMRLVAPLM